MADIKLSKKYVDDFIVVSVERKTNDFVVLELKHPGRLPFMEPGQFVQARVDGTSTVYLRRPISIHDVAYETNTIKLLVQEVGDGTRWITSRSVGDVINLIYPLGNWFKLPLNKSDKVLLVGGGCGVAPLLFLGKKLKQYGFEPQYLIGAKSEKNLVQLIEYEKLGTVHITTEDGSVGVKGFVIHHPVMKTFTPDFDLIYTCGPEPMMKVLAKYAANHQIGCQVSLENNMACGFGACLCCVTATHHGNKCTCIEGPVFDSKELIWQI
ncbi:MAG: dihydroorotate dehydrogenase electron transfer subunit [Breznakibacter sp.]